ncbi:MAG: hypothetical protein ACREI8_14145, partial [Myxococcota bacterium]
YRSVRLEGAEESVHYRHRADGRPLHLLEADLDWPNEHGLEARRFRRALFVGDPEHRSGDPIENLDRL